MSGRALAERTGGEGREGLGAKVRARLTSHPVVASDLAAGCEWVAGVPEMLDGLIQNSLA